MTRSGPRHCSRKLAFTQTADGGWERDGVALQGLLLTSNRAPNEAIATLIQSQLQAIGVPMEIQQLDSRAVMDATTAGAFDLLLWRFEWSDPDGLRIFLGSDAIGGTNRTAYSNPAKSTRCSTRPRTRPTRPPAPPSIWMRRS
jgi:ABC-type transport system substrate-binding protein